MCRQVRVPTMWGIPLRLFLLALALALGAVLPALDRALAPPLHAVAVRVCRLLNPGALLRHLAAEGRCVVLASHSPAIFDACDEVVEIS